MFTIPKQYSSITFIQDTSWQGVFDTWRDLEAWQNSWKQHWEERGFDSWDEWRKAYIEPYHPESLSWALYKITDPLQDVPHFYGTPTKGWIEKVYNGETTLQLKDLVTHPVITNNEKIIDIKKDFPPETMLTGIIFEDKIVLLEGMHRANAITTWNPKDAFTGTITIALAEWKHHLIKIGGNYKSK